VAIDHGSLIGVIAAGGAAALATHFLERSRGSARSLTLCSMFAVSIVTGGLVARPLLPVVGSPLAVLVMAVGASSIIARVIGGAELSTPLGATSLAWPLVFITTGGVPRAIVGIVGLTLPVFLRRANSRLLTIATRHFLLPSCILVFAWLAFGHEPFVGDLFEDGHSLLPANEYLHGRLPYRDIVPGHGFIADGGFQVVALSTGADNYSCLRAAERIVGTAFWPAVYWLALLSTGREWSALLASLLLFLVFPQAYFLRVLWSLITLAVAFRSLARQTNTSWITTGACTAIGLLVAVEFGTYTLVAVVVAAVLSETRGRSLCLLATGAFLVALPLIIVAWRLGILAPAIDVAFRLYPSLTPVYSVGIPSAWLPFDQVIPIRVSREDVIYGASFIAALASIPVVLGSTLRRRYSARVAVVLLVWFVVASLSVVERAHTGYPLFVIPLAFVILIRLWFPPIFVTAGVILFMLILGPLTTLDSLFSRFEPLIIPSEWAPVTDPPRAGGAYFRAADRSLISTIAALRDSGQLGPTDTWLDLVNSPGLYYLYDVHCPLRYYEVGFLQPPERQREALRAISTNQRVVIALLPATGLAKSIDGIPNRARVPALFNYVETHFHPLLTSDDVAVWRRNE